MGNLASIGITAILLAASTGVVLAQGSASTSQTMPNSNMDSPSGNTGGANNGVGQQGSLTGNAGRHSSTFTGAAAAALIPTNPKPAGGASHSDPAVEKDPSQGGGKQH